MQFHDGWLFTTGAFFHMSDTDIVGIIKLWKHYYSNYLIYIGHLRS